MRILILFVLAGTLLPAQQSTQTAAALAAGSYFPLDVGNRWVFRVDDRDATASFYETWRVDRAEDVDGKQYSVFTILWPTGVAETRFRADEQGRIFVLTGSGDELFLDTTNGSDSGQLHINGPGGSYSTAAGTFSDTLVYTNFVNSFIRETGQLARGVGLLWSKQTLIAGSSGGFDSGRTLVEAVVGGGAIRFTATAGIHLSMESLVLDVSGKQVQNCMLPCYFAACGFGGGTPPDPPGTYKPCARASVSLENWPNDASRVVRLRFTAPDSTVFYDKQFTIVSAPGDAGVMTQIPLYTAPTSPCRRVRNS